MNKKITKDLKFYGKFMEFKEKAPKEIQILMLGEWEHDAYGKINIDKRCIAEFKQNFDNGLRKGVPINAGHDTGRETEAVGWMKKLVIKDDGLYAEVEWTSKGKELLADKAFKFFSPEFFRIYEDPETHDVFTNVIVGGALTNKPYFKGLKAIATSEPDNNLKFSENTMNIKEILAKKAGTLSEDEKKHLRSHMSELSAENISMFAEDIAEAEKEEKTEEKEEKTEEKEEEKTDEKKEETVSASELESLREKAALGEQAFNERQAEKIQSDANKMVFSSVNKEGKFLAKSKDKLVTFMEGLTEKQREAFNEVISLLPKADMFGEIGDDGDDDKNAEKTTASELETKVQAKLKDNDEMSYSEALKVVMSESPELAEAYEKEIG